MRLKSIGIFLLSLLLIIVLLQFDAIANLNPIFYVLSETLDRVFDWASNPYPAETQQITLPLKHEFLNGENSGIAPVRVPQSTTRQPDSTDPKLQRPNRLMKEDTFWLLDDEFRLGPQDLSRNAPNSNPLFSLQEMVNGGDPVTDLFPETSSYDDIDNEYWEDSLPAGEENSVILRDEPIRSEFVTPLLDELKTQIQQRLEPNQLEEMLEQ